MAEISLMRSICFSGSVIGRMADSNIATVAEPGAAVIRRVNPSRAGASCSYRKTTGNLRETDIKCAG